MADQKIDILKAGVVSLNDQGHVLLSRDKGSTKWIVLGGTIEEGESHVQTIKREMKEEVGVEVEVNPTMYAESAPFPAANDPGKIVKIFYYFCTLLSEPKKFIEDVEEVKWFSKGEVESGKFEFGKSTIEFFLPKLIKDGFLK